MAQQNTIQDTKSLRFDVLKWLLIVFLLTTGVVANFCYSHAAVAIRVAIGILLTILVLVIASQTKKGQKVYGFMKGSRIELRKVVWPTRQETIQTTLVVVVTVIITALILWGLDSFFMWAVAWITRQRGS